jgi:hypothetical protein
MAGPRALAGVIPDLAGKVMGRKAQAFLSLLGEWPSVVGPRMAERVLPLKLSFPPGRREGATLTLRVAGSLALDFQHLQPQILERINGFFGYQAVVRLKTVQGPGLRPPGKPVRLRPLTGQEEQRLSAAVSGVEDAELSAALASFGRAMLGRQPAQTAPPGTIQPALPGTIQPALPGQGTGIRGTGIRRKPPVP